MLTPGASPKTARIRTEYHICASEVEAAFVPEDVTLVETARRLVREHLALPSGAPLWSALRDCGSHRDSHYYAVSLDDPVQDRTRT